MNGNIVVDNLVARSGSIIKGNITCKSLSVEQYVTIIGRANIHTLAPEYIDHNGDIIIDAPEVEVLLSSITISFLLFLFFKKNRLVYLILQKIEKTQMTNVIKENIIILKIIINLLTLQ